ncbi:hypothetical protein KM043_007972 [Ampulex compressa]|nr:hypothetical protein KM043_007972 [Ampulex compressa]
MSVDELLQSFGVGVRHVDDPFFEDSYRTCKVFLRKGITVEDDEELCHEVIRKFPCHNPECDALFNTLLDFEIHYNSNHRYVCAECKKSKPNSRMLDIHILETHDSYFKVLSAKQPMYQCFISDCNIKFNTPNERREHCKNVHKFSSTYRFEDNSNVKEKVNLQSQDKMDIDQADNINVKKKNSKPCLNKNQRFRMFTGLSKTPVANNTDVISTNADPQCTNLGKSALTFVPHQVQKGYAKALTKSETHERNILETENMMDLADSLPD